MSTPVKSGDGNAHAQTTKRQVITKPPVRRNSAETRTGPAGAPEGGGGLAWLMAQISQTNAMRKATSDCTTALREMEREGGERERG